MMLALGVALAGAAGAICRYAVDGAVQQRWRGAFPAGTLVVNLSGSLVLGGIVGYFAHHAGAPSAFRVVAGTGFVGAYTTFSTYAYESMRLMADGAWLEAFLNVAGSVALGLAVAAAGFWLGGRL